MVVIHNKTIVKLQAPVTSIYKIAKLANVSPATVSRVLNNKDNIRSGTRKKILQLIQEHQYQPRVMKTNTLNIGFLMQSTAELIGNYVSEIFKGVFEYCVEFDYNLVMYSIHEQRLKRQGFMSVMREGRIDGVIVLMTDESSQYLYDLSAEKFPYILVNNGTNDESFNTVDTDDAEGIRKAVKHLADYGHKKILFLQGDVRNQNHMHRSMAFQDSMKELGLISQAMTAPFDIKEKYVNSFEEGYNQTKKAFQSGLDFTAIVANNDDQAVGAMRAIGETKRRIPEDVSIVGFDNYSVTAFLNPPLTTVSQSLMNMGRLAAEKLITIIRNPGTKPVQVKLPPELVIRESTRNIRGS
jgi:LacI family transcriptional regulator